ncbi:MAG: hypothetical protein JNL65_13420 [Saprospiraceae bacterium]|nr:hypothetical protein [Saprospiraceae bacterium]HRG69182.1 hypothetical protein [Saprospiraceae bacterium]
MKLYIGLSWAAIICLFLSGALHSISLFVEPAASNDIEKQLIQTMDTYQMDMGAGYHRTFAQIFFSLSACFSLLCLFASVLLWYLLKHPISKNIMMGILNIYLIFFGVLAILMWVFTFLPPIICTSLSFLFLLGTRWSLGKMGQE